MGSSTVSTRNRSFDCGGKTFFGTVESGTYAK